MVLPLPSVRISARISVICLGSRPTVGSHPQRPQRRDCMLVQHQHFRIAAHGLRHTGALAVSLAQVRKQTGAHMGQPRQLHHLVHMRRDRPAFHAPQLGNKAQILPYRHFVIQRRMLRQIANQPFGFLRRQKRIVPVHQYLAGRGRQIAGEDVEKRRFACAVYAKQAQYASFFNPQIHIPERLYASIPAGYVCDFNQNGKLLYVCISQGRKQPFLLYHTPCLPA